MKKKIFVICILCAALVFTGCATIPEFKSMKEAECYAGTMPISERFTKFGIEAYALNRPMNRKKGGSGSLAVGVAAAAATGAVTMLVAPLALSVIPSPWSDYKSLTGGVSFSRMPMIVFREKSGETIWNVAAEALKRAGAPPKSDSCIYEGIRVEPTLLGTSKYEGEDGKIVVADGLSIHLYFVRNTKAEPPCDGKAWQVYVDYVKTVADHAKNIIAEEFALTQRTRFCATESKNKQ